MEKMNNIFIKGQKKALNKWREYFWSWIGRINFIKVSITSKLIYKFNEFLS